MTSPKMDDKRLEDFSVGDQVTYVPYHAHGKASHPDCERGVVSSKNDLYVFVRFGCSTTGQACKPDQLIRG